MSVDTPPPPTAKDLVEESIAKLQSGEYISTPKVFMRGNRHSQVWDSFQVVVDRATRLEVGTAQCLMCDAILTRSQKSVPSSLKKHKDNYCPGQQQNGANTPFRPVPGVLRNVFVDKVADTSAVTTASVNLLTSDAVISLIQTAVDISVR